ncbi:MAG: VWA domain-containing protein [Myxococcales bacterium]|nr:VWA domain-containing protein [Myxococcales bacterium]
MTWHSPVVLWFGLAVLVVAGVLVVGWRLRERATRRFGEPTALQSLRVGRSGPLRAARGVLLVLGLFLVVGALAGPQYGSRTRVLRQRGIDVVVALDFSKSMLARDVSPNRSERAKVELTRFIEELGGDRVGVVAFAGETMQFPLTTDYAAVQLFLRDLTPLDMPVGGTAIGRALVAAGRLLERSSRAPEGLTEAEWADTRPARVVVLMTDGEDHEGDPVQAARNLAAEGVKIFVVGIGSRTGEPIPTYSEDGTWTGYMRDAEGNVVTTSLTAENEVQLQEIAAATGGRYLRAEDGGVGVDQVAREIRTLQQGERESRRVTVHENRFALALLPGFLLLVLEALLPEAWLLRRRRLAGGRPQGRLGRLARAGDEREAAKA